ncbi:MAG TPA: N-acetyltransferase [Chthonomonadales bacterium]|nr:N-acetyltransferase [Chthonomonadales bacterium]
MSHVRGAGILPTIGTLRKARPEDVTAIQRLVNGFAQRDLMLPRSLSQLYENVRDFNVIEEDGRLVGCAALHVSWRDLAEIKSLAVSEESQGIGHGRRLVDACVAEASDLGIARVFALTYVAEWFEKLGWVRVDKASLPRKVWTECVYCPKFQGCTEVAVVLDL